MGKKNYAAQSKFRLKKQKKTVSLGPPFNMYFFLNLDKVTKSYHQLYQKFLTMTSSFRKSTETADSEKASQFLTLVR